MVKKYPCIYTSTTKDFNNNGEGTLIDIINPKSTVERNTIYEFTFDYPVDGKRAELLEELNLIKTDMTAIIKDQIYIIYNVSKPIRGVISIKCMLKTLWDLLTDDIGEINLTNVTCTNALNEIFNKSQKCKSFLSESNITHTANFNKEFTNCKSAIQGSQGSILDTFGHEPDILYTNNKVSVNQDGGKDTDILIAWGKNITEFTESKDSLGLATRIRPFAKIQGENEKEITLTLPEIYVDSEYINNYPEIYTKELDLSSSATTIEDLRNQTKAHLKNTKCDIIGGNIKLSFVELAKTKNYAAMSAVQTLNIYDYAIVRVYKYNIDIKEKIVKTEYNPVLGEYISLEFGDIRGNASNLFNDIDNDLNNIKKEQENSKDFISKAIDNATDIITGNKGGNVLLYPKDKPQEIYIMDTDNVNTAKQVLRINKSGIGFSSSGVNGPFATAWTLDGGFVADFINAGLLNASLLKTGSIKNINGTLEINLESSNGIMTKANGKNAINLSSTNLEFFDWDGKGSPVGLFYTAHLEGTDNVAGLSSGHNTGKYLSLTYQRDGVANTYGQYILFDKNKVVPSSNVPITIYEETDFRGNQLWFNYGVNSIYNSQGNNLVIKVLNDYLIADNSGNNRIVNKKDSFACYDTNNSKIYFRASTSGFSFWLNAQDALFTSTTGNLVSKMPLFVENSLTVTGNKNCVQKTDSYGSRLYYSVEDCESYLTDRTIHTLKVEETSAGTFERVVLLDPIFKESVNLELDYAIEILKQGWGDYRIKEQTKDYFIVESDRKDFTFKYVITAKRRGFEDQRNNEFFGHSELYKSEPNKINHGLSEEVNMKESEFVNGPKVSNKDILELNEEGDNIGDK